MTNEELKTLQEVAVTATTTYNEAVSADGKASTKASKALVESTLTKAEDAKTAVKSATDELESSDTQTALTAQAAKTKVDTEEAVAVAVAKAKAEGAEEIRVANVRANKAEQDTRNAQASLAEAGNHTDTGTAGHGSITSLQNDKKVKSIRIRTENVVYLYTLNLVRPEDFGKRNMDKIGNVKIGSIQKFDIIPTKSVVLSSDYLVQFSAKSSFHQDIKAGILVIEKA